MVSWRKSTYSDGNGGSCVEVAGAARVVLVRDTKDRNGGTLTFSAQAWRAFAELLKRRLALGRVQHLSCTQFPSQRTDTAHPWREDPPGHAAPYGFRGRKLPRS